MRAPDSIEVAAGLASLALLLFLSTAPSGVKADVDPNTQRYEPIASYSSPSGHMQYNFDVFRDKTTGVEIVCIYNEVHYQPSCLPTGRKW